jgi:hypothetical protein
MANYRIMTAMVLFRFEQELGKFVTDRSANLAEIIDIADAVGARDGVRRREAMISTAAQLVRETYLEDLFQLALRVTESSTDHSVVSALKDLSTNLSLNEIRNAVCHPNRPFPECYWFRVAAIATDPAVAQLEFADLPSCLEAALAGQLEPPPADWMTLPSWEVPNNLPVSNDFEITGLIGRPKETKELQKLLLNQRIGSLAIVAPGGVGKTALTLDVLEKLCKTPSFHDSFDAVIFLSLKFERLTASGIMKLDAPSSIVEIEAQLNSVVPFVVGSEGDVSTFLQLKERYADRRLLLFIDNLETLLRDDPEEFNEFQINLPVCWRIVVTSRVAINSATCLTIGPLNENNAKHLARIYATRRNAAGLMNDNAIEKIVQRTRFNPLAIRLGVDAYMLGSQLEDALEVAARDVLAFSYTNLLEVISNESIAILECLFLQDPQSRIELAENLSTSIDQIAQGLGELTRTSLILRNNENREELYSLYPAIRDLLLINPRDAALRSTIQKKIYQRRESILGHETRQGNLSRFHVEYVEPDLPVMVRNICFETNSVIKSLYKNATPEQALRILERLRTLKLEYPDLSILPRFIARLHSRLGDSRTAMAELSIAIAADASDIRSLQLLARLAYDEHDYKLSLSSYTAIRDHAGWDPAHTDEYTVRYCYNGYLIALLYLGDNNRIIEETEDWQANPYIMDLSGAFRARALKRTVESSLIIGVKVVALDAAISILDEICKRFGYARWTYSSFEEVIEAIVSCAQFNGFTNLPEALRLLKFAERHLINVYRDRDGDSEKALRFVSSFREVKVQNNPFVAIEWLEFLTSKGGQVYVDAEFKDSLKHNSYISVRVYHVKKAAGSPKNGPAFVFARDDSGTQYYISQSALAHSSRKLWAKIEEGAELAIHAEKTAKSFRATEAHII